MATAQKGARKSGASGGRASASEARAGSAAGRSRVSGRGQQDRKPSAIAAFYRQHRSEIWGLVAVVLALLAALGIYGHVGGPVGVAFRRVSGLAVGWGRLVVPPALAAMGVLLISGRAERRDSGGGDGGGDGESEGHSGAERRSSVRITGGALLIVALAGILHLGVGRPGWGDALADFEGAGGYVGYAFGAGLSRLVGLGGAVVVLVALGLLGWPAVSGMPLSRVAAVVWALTKRTWLLVVALERLVVKDRDPLSEEVAAGPTATPAGQAGAADSAATATAGLTPPLAAAAAAPLSGGPPAGMTNDPDDAGVDAAGRAGGGAGEPWGSMSDGGDAAAAAGTGKTRRKAGKGAGRPSAEPSPGEEIPVPVSGADDGRWRRPALGLLKTTPQREVDHGLIEERGRALEEALAAHGVEVKLAGVVVGPTVSRYELVLGEGVKVGRFTALSRDIAYALASPDVRILAPIPGRQAIGVEVPNPRRQVVTVGDILTSDEATGAEHPLDVAIGRDITGQAVMANLGRMPHLLIAGATGAGKSSCINSIITSILMRCTPEQVRLILVDPKMVEMRQYANVPHLLTQPVIDPKKAANALGWAVKEMERRYELLSRVGCRDITGYNEMYEASRRNGNDAADEGTVPDDGPAAGTGNDDEDTLQRLPFIVIVVDELSDLMMVAPREVEDAIWRLAQMARAVGVHLVIATQRPSTNVITGVIKANIPTRLALSVSSLTDSRVILDQGGAERLVGHGDMLLLDATSSTPRRIQGAWASEEEIRRVTAVWRRQNTRPDPSAQGITAEDLNTTMPLLSRDGDPGDDELLQQAKALVVESRLGSTSMLQRKLRVGFARAGRLMDLLEQRGVVGPSEGSKAREVLMTTQELAIENAAVAAEGRPVGADI